MYRLRKDDMDKLRVTWTPDLFKQPWAIETHKNGVIAYTKSNDESRTVTVYCRGDGLVRVLLTSPDLSFQKSHDGLMLDVFGIATTRHKTRMISGRIALEAELLPQEFATAVRLMATGKGLSVSAPNVGNSWYNIYSFGLPAENARAAILVASRNCTG
jgi:hypothetical protein